MIYQYLYVYFALEKNVDLKITNLQKYKLNKLRDKQQYKDLIQIG